MMHLAAATDKLYTVFAELLRMKPGPQSSKRIAGQNWPTGDIFITPNWPQIIDSDVLKLNKAAYGRTVIVYSALE